MYQVNVSESVDGTIEPWIIEYDPNGYRGILVDVSYINGSDRTNHCEFVGTYQECIDYIKKEYGL